MTITVASRMMGSGAWIDVLSEDDQSGWTGRWPGPAANDPKATYRAHMPPRKQQHAASPKAEIEDALSMVLKQEAGRGSVSRFIGKAAEVRVNRVIRFTGPGAASPLP